MNFASVFSRHQRQVHLDFHTSPAIPDVGVEFDAGEFAATMKRAHVNSVTVFAKCHHGMCYFPTETGVSHPALGGRDLLGEQIEALHREGIRAPIYTTVAWEENAADRFPMWRQMARDGHFAGTSAGPDGKPGHVGMWRFLNFLDPGYQDYIEAHVREICGRYGDAVDGLFFDIVFLSADACWSPASRRFRERRGLTGTDAATTARFHGEAQAAFAMKFTRMVRGLSRRATIFYNAPNEASMDPSIGPRSRAAHVTHFEIESLPSGFWGYYHFPRMARAQSRWGKPWLGMTGRFQKMWGDFGGIKPRAALEYECFRSQALGGGNSVGDQLPPRGTPDPAAYDLIGAVYEQCAAAEPFYAESEPLPPEVGILSANFAGVDGGRSEEGAVLLCEEAHFDCAMFDGLDSLDGVPVVMLPDSTTVSPEVVEALRAYHAGGGSLVVSHCGGFDGDGRWALDFLPVSHAGETELFPTYWRARKAFDAAMSVSDRVFYEAGMNLLPLEGASVLVDRVPPYFRRTAATFSSHFQTPPVAKAGKFPAVVAGERFVVFADPIFREYRQTGNLAVRETWWRVIERLIGPPAIGAGLSSNILLVPRRRGDDLLLTLLHYVPVRKALDIDVIDAPSTFAGEVLRFREAVSRVRVVDSSSDLDAVEERGFALPARRGRLLLEVPGYFSPGRVG